MNQQQLRAFLDREGVPRSWYRLEGDPPDWEETRLEHAGDAWEVTFDDRGTRVVLGSYETEDEACDFLASYMLTTKSESSPVPPEVLGTSGT